MILAILLAPWRGLRWTLSVIGGALRSARFWTLLILAIISLLVGYYALANRYVPSTGDAFVQAFVVQVAPQVEGQVVDVRVSENQLVQKGQILFEIDSRPYEHKVRQLEAGLAKTVQEVAQLGSALEVARAERNSILADLDYAHRVHEQEKLIYAKDATTERKLLDAQQKHLAAKALLEKSEAVIREKEEALRARIGSEHALVAEAKAQLATARLNLEWTKVLSPATGYITDLQLRVGSYVQPGHPVFTCIDKDQWWIVANFREGNLEFMRPGQPAGIVLKTYPGRIYSGKVQTVGWGVDQGQGVPSGKLPAVKNPLELIPSAQRFQVRLTLEHPDDIDLRVGATGAVTVYTTPDSPLNPLARFWQRIESWIFYLR
jgi:multidrug resistance efflux pump